MHAPLIAEQQPTKCATEKELRLAVNELVADISQRLPPKGGKQPAVSSLRRLERDRHDAQWASALITECSVALTDNSKVGAAVGIRNQSHLPDWLLLDTAQVDNPITALEVVAAAGQQVDTASQPQAADSETRAASQAQIQQHSYSM